MREIAALPTDAVRIERQVETEELCDVFDATMFRPSYRKVVVRISRAPECDDALRRIAGLGGRVFLPVLDSGETAAGRPFVVQELPKQPDALAHFGTLPVPAWDRFALARALARELVRAHAAGLVHGSLWLGDLGFTTQHIVARPVVGGLGRVLATDPCDDVRGWARFTYGLFAERDPEGEGPWALDEDGFVAWGGLHDPFGTRSLRSALCRRLNPVLAAASEPEAARRCAAMAEVAARLRRAYWGTLPAYGIGGLVWELRGWFGQEGRT